MLQPGQKLSVSWDASGDQPTRFPRGYYIAVVLEWSKQASAWVNSGRVYHVTRLADLDALLARDADDDGGH